MVGRDAHRYDFLLQYLDLFPNTVEIFLLNPTGIWLWFFTLDLFLDWNGFLM